VCLIRRLDNALVKKRNQILVEYNLTAAQADVIAFILKNRDEGEINLLDVQRYLMVSHPTVVGIVSRLEEKGLLSQEQSERDARFVRLKPTRACCALEEVLKQAAADSEARILRSMTKSERAEFVRLLELALQDSGA
jgi:DNA-binding MarR family transcriptional regulator